MKKKWIVILIIAVSLPVLILFVQVGSLVIKIVAPNSVMAQFIDNVLNQPMLIGGILAVIVGGAIVVGIIWLFRLLKKDKQKKR